MTAIPKRAVSDEFLACRALGHAWEPTAPGLYASSVGSRHLFLACVRCATEKVQDMDDDGSLWGTHYRWSDQYRGLLDDEAFGRLDRKEYRAELERRAKKAAS